MNKLLIVLLAVCLVSVHAFVKRDTATAPAGETNALDNMGKDILSLAEKIKDELSKSFDAEKIKEGLAKTFDPEKMKTDFNALVDKVNEAAKSLAPKADAPKP